MKTNILNLVMIIALTTCFNHASFASSLNIDFGVSYTGLPNTYGAASGQIGDWNNVVQTGLTASLFDTSGVVTGIDLTLSAEFPYGDNDSPSNNDTTLMNDNFFSSNSLSWSVTLSGINQGVYDIYYYAPAHSLVSTGLFSINGISVSSLTGSLMLTQGISWDVLSGVSIDSAGLLSIQSESNDSFRGLSGLQIVSVSTVPIPTAIWLFGSGLLGLIGVARRKNTA